MTSGIATVVFALGILGLFLLDRDRKSRVSPALWIPVAWLLLAGSRMVSEWLEPVRAIELPDQLLEGNPLNRLILTGLLAAGAMVLLARGRRDGSRAVRRREAAPRAVGFSAHPRLRPAHQVLP